MGQRHQHIRHAELFRSDSCTTAKLQDGSPPNLTPYFDVAPNHEAIFTISGKRLVRGLFRGDPHGHVLFPKRLRLTIAPLIVGQQPLHRTSRVLVQDSCNPIHINDVESDRENAHSKTVCHSDVNHGGDSMYPPSTNPSHAAAAVSETPINTTGQCARLQRAISFPTFRQ